MTNTPRYGHEPIAMRQVSPPQYSSIERPGDYYIKPADPTDPELHHLGLGLPTAGVQAFTFSEIKIKTNGDPKREHHWGWDGNKERPTLTPSVHAVGHWHGYVRDGSLVEA